MAPLSECIDCSLDLCRVLQLNLKETMHMATWEGALYGGKTRKPSALVLYIMEHVNPGLLEPYQEHWHNIVGKSLWLAFWKSLNREEMQRFYQEPEPDGPSGLEKATKDVYLWAVEDAARWEGVDQPITHPVQTKLKPGTLRESSFCTTKTHLTAKPNQLLPHCQIGPISLNRDLIGLKSRRAGRVRVY